MTNNIERVKQIQGYKFPAIQTQCGTIFAIENGLLVGQDTKGDGEKITIEPEQLSESELVSVVDHFPNIHGEQAYAAKQLLRRRFGWFKSLRRDDFETWEEYYAEKEALKAELKALFNIEGVSKIPQLVYSENQLQFIEDVQNCGLDVRYDYSGRGMYGDSCPSVTVDSFDELTTTAKWTWDNMGLSYVMYAQH